MTYRVVLTDLAEKDVDTVLSWFRDQQAIAARSRWLGQFLSRLDTLATHPDRCPLAAEAEEVGEEIREILIGRRRFKDRILFKISGRTVSILRVWHSSRDAFSRCDLAE